MATATPTTKPRSPAWRRVARELTRLRRAEALYVRRDQPTSTSDEYRWYRAYLLDEYPAYVG